MTREWLYLVLIIPAVMLACDDFRFRRVHILWLIVLGALSVLTEGCFISWHLTVMQILFNSISIGLLLGGVTLWIWIRHRQSPRNLFSQWLGAGDFFMMLTTTPLFTQKAYVYYLLVSCGSSLVWWSCRKNKHVKTIPLAGFMALILIIYSIGKFIFL